MAHMKPQSMNHGSLDFIPQIISNIPFDFLGSEFPFGGVPVPVYTFSPMGAHGPLKMDSTFFSL